MKLLSYATDAIKNVADKLKKPDMELLSKARGEHITGTWNIYPYNPDDLIIKKGYEVLDKMRTDDQVRAVMTMKKFARLAPGWDIRPASDAKNDVAAADFCRWNLQQLPGTFENRLLQLMSALDYGFSVGELNWEHKKEVGHKYNGKFVLGSLKFRRPHYIVFFQDEHGNLEEDGIGQEQRNGTITRIPTDKFLRYTYQEEFDNLYGQSDYRNFYREWWIKTVVLKFYAMYLERFPFPPTFAWYPPGASKKNINDLEDILERLQVASTGVLPQGYTLDQLEIPSTGAEIYKEALLEMNRGIIRGALCPELMASVGERGSYALGKKHFDVFLWIVTQLGKELNAIVSEQLLTVMTQYNFDAQIPAFVMQPPEDDLVARSKVLDILLKGQIIDPDEEWVRDYMDVPKKDQPYKGRFSIPTSTVYAEGIQATPTSKAISAEPEITEAFPYRSLTLAERATGMDYDRLSKSFGRWVSKISNTVERELHTEIGKILPTVKGIFAGKNLQAARNLKFDVGKVRNSVLSVFLETYLEAKLDGIREIETSLDERINFGEDIAELVKFQQPPKPEEMIARFKGRIPMTKDEWKQLLPRMRSRAFTVAGQIHKDIVSDIQELIYRAINEDWDMNELLAAVEKKGISYTGRAWQFPPETPMKPYHTELIFRNAISTIYNDARMKLFNHPDVRNYVPALQYSAILDTRTRDTHRAMDGRIYKRTDDIWKNWKPPAGHNCRCTVIPVTTNVPYSLSPPTDLKPDEGFGRGA